MRRLRTAVALVAVALSASLAVGAGPASAAKASTPGVTGLITSSITGKPLAGICVHVVEASTNTTVGTSAETSKTGIWTVSNIPASTDDTAIAEECKTGDYVPQWYDEQAFQSDATDFTVTSGSTTTGINFMLDEGGAVSGKVTDATTKKPVAGILVVAYYTFAFQPDAAVCTTAKGTYSLPGVPAGGVKVGYLMNDCKTTTPYQPVYYLNAPDWDSATVVPIAAGKTTKNINQTLTPTG